ncbi:MAG: ATP-binding protein [Myxococcota bacterium]
MWGVWFLVAIPTVLILTCGILILAYQQSFFEVVIGLSLVIFCGALGAGVTLVVIGIRIDRRLSSLQMDFVSKVSHELKTPLTSIKMFVDTLKLGRVKDPAQTAECLEVIAKETDRLNILISRLLSWGAMEAGAYKIAAEEVGTDRLVRIALDAFEPQRLAGAAELTVNLAPDLPVVRADSSALADALLNLLTNALRYGGEHKRIEVSARRRGDTEVEIAVRDHGIGIELQHQVRIFERFYRADERYSRAVGGTGLGLAIAQHIVVAHRGKIEVKSRPGEGSTFTIVLPIVSPITEEEQQLPGARLSEGAKT